MESRYGRQLEFGVFPVPNADDLELVRAQARRAEELGRGPGEIRRLLNVSGKIVDGGVSELLVGPPEHWGETLTHFARDLGFDTFLFWANDEPEEQLERFATEVAPALR